MKKPIPLTSLLAVLASLGLGVALSAQGNPDLSAEPGLHRGLASKYPGDVGLSGDSSVVFYEDFETGFVSNLGDRWTSVNNLDNRVMKFVPDSVPGGHGRNSLQMTGTKGHDVGGDLWKKFDQGYDQLYARFYVKFAPDAPYVHHFVHMAGTTSMNPWPEGGAGLRPNGYDRFSTGIDLRVEGANPPGAWFFYTYWPEMHSWQTLEGVSDGRPDAFYGNPFGPPVERPEQAPRDRWQCVEIMIKLNSAPDSHDGEEAFWVDGRLIGRFATGSIMGTWIRDRFRVYGTEEYKGSASVDSIPKPFEGFLWRKTLNLKINTFQLEYYLASIFQNNVKPADPTLLYNADTARVEFDNVVLATRYIGPVVTQAEADSLKMGFDFNRDGDLGVGDVYRLLKMRIADPDDMRTDYNGDGRLTLSDAVQFLLDVLKGKTQS